MGVSGITAALILLVLLLCCIWCLICFLFLNPCRRRRRNKQAPPVLMSGDSMLDANGLLENRDSTAPGAPLMPHPDDVKGIGGRRRTTMMAMRNWLGTALGANQELTNLEDEMPPPPPMSQEIADDIDRHNALHAPHERLGMSV